MNKKAKNPPKISIITPSFNQGQFIGKTIESVLSQNYSNLEYIVMDGGSTDNTLDILKSYGAKIKYFSQKDHGQADAINQGLKKTTGEIVAYLNSDDILLPGSLQHVADHFINYPDSQWLTGDYQIINEYDQQIQPLVVIYKRLLRNLLSFNLLCIANPIVQPSTFWRRSLLKKVGFFNEKLHYCLDFDYWLRVIKKYPPFVTSLPLAAFRIHSTSKGKNLFTTQFNEEHQLVLQYTKNSVLRLAHYLHSQLIIRVYKMIK